MKQLVVLTGAGISAESGIATFRDSGGLWEGYDVMEVATPQAWTNNPKLVLDFYNMRRKDALHAIPNKAHKFLVKLEAHFNVNIITQNVDNLHERAGSKHILHLHGELFKSRSTQNPTLIYPIKGAELLIGDTCELGSQLRPHIVWFGEEVPKMVNAVEIVQKADILVIIGTSMVVYPAAGLINYIRPKTPIYVIDPGNPDMNTDSVTFINKKATDGVKKLYDLLID
ncbi:MAG: NAD-dependent deacylase [Cyclobacteriaceae bacterium]|nr:NAD-dependent deacylase [Cyclobacteriaceae bacterium]